MAAPTSAIPPLLQPPSDKERKYDRQLRLWAASGQTALENASILLVNSGGGTVGVETLKNLVLPGIGKFTIADEAVVEDADLGVNFFLDESSKGKSRAKCCTEMLLELNPEVQGSWYPQNVGPFNLQQFLETSPPFTMILYTLPLESLRIEALQTYAHRNGIPLLSVHSVGFYSYFSTVLAGPLPIVDTHPDVTTTSDLRLLQPWPELMNFAGQMARNIDDLDQHKHGHLPMVVILLHYLQKWKSTHNGKLPANYKDKSEFRKIVEEGMRRDNPEGGEENFEEAVAAVMKHIVTPEVPGSLKEIFDFQHQDAKPSASGFWLIAAAIKSFYERHSCLPLPGGIPDMKAESEVYIRLQNIYKDKARRDAAEVLELVRAMDGGEAVDPEEVTLFCTNARFVKLINGDQTEVKLQEVAEREFANDQIAAIAGPEMPMSLIPIYLALRATSHKPTASAEEIVSHIATEIRLPAAEGEEDTNLDRITQAAEEVSRAGGGEMHNISALMGGMVAQEMIKIITKQYIPIENTCIFDGIESRCQVLKL